MAKLQIKRSTTASAVPTGLSAGELAVNLTDEKLFVGTGSGNVEIGGASYVDLTSATEDYLLAVGQTATITYTSATSVPLHVKTIEGVYTVDIVGDQSVTIGTSGDVLLQPNNTTVTAGTIDLVKYYIAYLSTATPASATISGVLNGTTLTSFVLCDHILVKSHMEVSTITNSKTIHLENLQRNSSTQFYVSKIYLNWLDTTTAWTSLGTITFPFSQSGKIVVKRII